MKLDLYDFIDIYFGFKIDENKNKYLDLNTLIINGRENRHQGYGTICMNNIINTAIKNQCKYIYLKADTKQPQKQGFILVEWYEKFGFKQINKIGYFVEMKKEL